MKIQESNIFKLQIWAWDILYLGCTQIIFKKYSQSSAASIFINDLLSLHSNKHLTFNHKIESQIYVKRKYRNTDSHQFDKSP